MSQTLSFDWLSRRSRRKLVPSRQLPHRRPLRFEPLEDRRVLAALVGVDFGLGSAPPNWAQISAVGSTAFPTTRMNLTDESGAATLVDLTISTTFAGNAFSAAATINPNTLPQHTPSLADVSNIVNVDGANGVHRFDATWSDLKLGALYEVYVFGLESRH